MTTRKEFSPINYFVTLLMVFIVAQVSIWILSKYTDFEFLAMGFVLFLFLIIAFITSLFVMGLKLGNLRKEDFIFIGIQFIAIVGAFIYLPDYVPQIFSTYSIEISESIREAAGSIVSITGTGIV